MYPSEMYPPRLNAPPVVLRWQRALLLWAGLWGCTLLLGPDWFFAQGLGLNEHGHAHLYEHGHPFADARSWWGIPNTCDVLSNLPLLLVGVWGWRRIQAHWPGAAPERLPALWACGGLVLTWAGSSFYHLHPSAHSLVLDRLGMAVTFAGVLAWALAQRLPPVWSGRWGLAVGVAGVLSAALPAWNGHVLPWAVLQFGGLALVCAHALCTAWRAPAGSEGRWAWLGLVAWYGLAKALELHDAQVFAWTHQGLGGHALKHLAAACSLTPLLFHGAHRAPATPHSSQEDPNREYR